MPQQVHRKRRVQGRERTDQLVCYTGYGGMSGPLSWGIQSGRFVLRNQQGGRFQLCCRSLRCKGYGLCDPVTGLCACNPGFTASNCDVKLTCPNDWKSYGICAFRKCMCGPSYTGDDCSQLVESACEPSCALVGQCAGGVCHRFDGVSYPSRDACEVREWSGCSGHGYCCNGASATATSVWLGETPRSK